MAFVRVAPVDTDALRFASSLPLKDLEDGMIVGAARACGALYIATRNVRRFKQSPVPARTPAQLLAEWAWPGANPTGCATTSAASNETPWRPDTPGRG